MRWFISLIILIGLIILVFGSVEAQNLNDGIIVHYSFDGHAIDDSGHKLNGKVLGVVPSNNRLSEKGKAFYFDGNSYIETPTDSRMYPEFPFSIAFWFRAEIIKAPDNLILTTCYNRDQYHGLTVFFGSNRHVVGLTIGDGGPTVPEHRRSKVGTTIIQEGEWYHFAAVIESTEKMTIYINGCDDLGSYSGTGERKIVYNKSPGNIGRADSSNDPNDPDQYYKGDLDEFYMWDRALTAEEVALLYLGNMNYDIELGGDKILCEGREYPISVHPIYDRITWSTGDTTPTLIVTKPGKYWVEGFIENCFYFRDTVEFKGSKCLKGGCGCK